MRPAAWLLLGVGMALGLGCASGLPDYAAPSGQVMDTQDLDLSDIISYRTLERSDFKGQEPPPEVAPYEDKVGAATCAHIMTTPGTRVMVRAGRTPDGLSVYQAIPDQVRFQARMDRKCSWWNPRGIDLPADYILQHEQIHFALFELEARRLNASIHEIESRLHATGQSPEEAAGRAQEQLTQEIRARMGSILARSREFDEDTSMGHRPDAQLRWWNQVQAELAASADQATGPAPGSRPQE